MYFVHPFEQERSGRMTFPLCEIRRVGKVIVFIVLSDDYNLTQLGQGLKF